MANRLKALAEIPTLTSLYRVGKLLPSQTPDLATGIQRFNDTICTIRWDITKLEVDAIVNAANGRLLGGGGVDGAIHTAAGDGLYDECKTLGGCKTGSAKITGGHNLPCKKIVHAVGPVYRDDEHSEPLLRGCYKTALELAVENDCKSIAFSAISTGIYGYPSGDAAKAALREVRLFLMGPDGKKLDKIIFCSFMEKDVAAYNKWLPEIFPPVTEISPSETEDEQVETKLGEYASSPALKGNFPTDPTNSNLVTSEVAQSPPRTNSPKLCSKPSPKSSQIPSSTESDRAAVASASEHADQDLVSSVPAFQSKIEGDTKMEESDGRSNDRLDANGFAEAEEVGDQDKPPTTNREQSTEENCDVQMEDLRRESEVAPSQSGLWTKSKHPHVCSGCGRECNG